jgi:dienelactone hydrolase
MDRMRGLLIATVALLVAGACGSGGSDAAPKPTRTTLTTSTVKAPGTGDGTFTMRTERFVDPSRPTGATPGRTLPTDIYVPGGKGPFPVIVHSHGRGGASRKFTQLLGEWAKAGYIVIAPNFLLTNADTPKDQQSLADFTSQPADVRFVLDQVLAEAEKGGRLAGLVATDRIGASGHSLGGATTYLGLFNTCCQDDRYRSAVLMSAVDLPHPDGEWDWTRSIPLLVFAGTADFSIPYDRQMATVAKLPTPAWVVTLDAGLHAPPYENAPDPHDEMVVATTIDFWNATLRDDRAAREQLATDATVPGLSSVRVTS